MINLENYKEYENYEVVLGNAKNIIFNGSKLKDTEFDTIPPNSLSVIDLVISNIFLAIKKEGRKYLYKLDITHSSYNRFRSKNSHDGLGAYRMEFNETITTSSDDVMGLAFIVEINTITKTVNITNRGNGWDCLNPATEEVDIIGFELYNRHSKMTIPANYTPHILSYNTCDNELIAAAIIIKDFNLELDEFKSIATSLLLFRGLSINTTNFFKDKEISYFLMNKDDYSTTIHAKHDNGEIIEVVIEHEKVKN